MIQALMIFIAELMENMGKVPMFSFLQIINITLLKARILEPQKEDFRKIGKNKNGLHVPIFLYLAVDPFDPLSNMYKKKK